MRNDRTSNWWVFLAVAGVLAAGSARAGLNTWTGVGAAASIVVGDPRDPDVVYAVFDQGNLVRSADGGRSWTRLATFDAIYSLLVHPASPDTLYIGAADLSGNGYSNVFKSSDRGATWTRTPSSQYSEGIFTLVGSRTDPNLVYAGSGGRLYRTADGGATWTKSADLVGAISSLIIHPQDASKLYVGTDGDGGYYYPFGAFAQSTNTGGNWTYDSQLGVLNHVSVALDAASPSTLFLGLARETITAERGVRRSDDGGATWVHAENGLPEGAEVEAIAIDPAKTATVYAGTRRGIYRSRDSGATWLPFSQLLQNVSFRSLDLSTDGRTVRAVTERGAFAFDVSEGPIDVAATGNGSSGVLSWNADRLSVQTLSGSGGWSASPFEGPVAAWQAVAAASSGDGRTRVLWQAGDGRWAVEVVGPGGRESAVVFAANDWPPVDISVGADGKTRLLFANADGGMYVASLDASGSVSPGPQYGPAGAWSAIALADAPDGATWVLWRSPDGRSAVSIHRDGVMTSSVRFEASADGAVVDLAVGGDGDARILVADAAGAARIWTVDSDGSRSAGDPLVVTGMSPRRLAAGSDGALRLLWASRSGAGAVSSLSAAGAVIETHDVPALP